MYFTASVDIDADEFYQELDTADKIQLMSWLIQDGFYSDEVPGFPTLIEQIKEQIYRLKYRGLDSEKTTVEILEEILEKAENL